MIHGFAIVANAAPPELLAALRDRFAVAGNDRRGGLRNALDISEVALAVKALRPLAEQLGEVENTKIHCVRGIVFDKTPAANWKVAWHQDRSIALAERHELPGYGPWSSKDGVIHVEPPTAVLERIITLRLHLDDCGEENGPLRVVSGSNRLGILSDEQIAAVHAGDGEDREVTLTCRAGDVIAMRPLLLHASSPAIAPTRRRVVHLEFSPDNLPPPLAWRWSV